MKSRGNLNPRKKNALGGEYKKQWKIHRGQNINDVLKTGRATRTQSRGGGGKKGWVLGLNTLGGVKP